MQKEDTTSPAVSIETLFISATIDAQEQRDVLSTDVRGSFMQADMVGEVNVKLEGRLAGILAKLDPTKYLHKENGRAVMYVILKKHYMELYKLQSFLEGSSTNSHLLGF